MIPHITIEQYEAMDKHRGMLNINRAAMNACIDLANDEQAEIVLKQREAYQARDHWEHEPTTVPYFPDTISITQIAQPAPSYSSGGGGDYGGGGASGSWSDSSSSDSSSSDSGSSSSD